MEQVRRFSGERLRQARHSKGWTQAELARHAGIRERQVIRWENEQNTPRIEAVAALARVTDCDFDFFFSESGAHDDDDEEESDTVDAVDMELLRALKKWRGGLPA